MCVPFVDYVLQYAVPLSFQPFKMADNQCSGLLIVLTATTSTATTTTAHRNIIW